MSEQSYTLTLTKEAKRDLAALDKPTAERIVKSLKRLASTAGLRRHEALTGRLSGLFKYRIGHYRAIYHMDREARLIKVVAIGHRREVYDDH